MNEIIKKNGIKFGIIAASISILITLSMYIIDLKLFTNMWIGFVKIGILIVLSIILLSTTKKSLNNNYSFKEAFTTYFICFVICILSATIFEIILFNFIDPEAKNIIQENLIEFQVDMLKKFNTPTSVIKETVAKLEENNPYDAFQIFKGSAVAIAVSSVFGLILAAIFKSKTQEQF